LGVADNAIYVSVEAKAGAVIFGNSRSFNPGLGTAKLGTVRFVPFDPPSDPNQPDPAPTLLFAGVQPLFEENRQPGEFCAVDTNFAPFVVTRIGSPGVENLDLSELSSSQSFRLGLDPDGDHFASDYDDCPFKHNDQSDNGSFDSVTNDGDNANGIGDACECGEVSDDGKVFSEDTEAIQDILVGVLPDTAEEEARCSTAGTPDCGPDDWVASWRAHRVAGAEVSAACAPALP
jgi:hypothetical protein